MNSSEVSGTCLMAGQLAASTPYKLILLVKAVLCLIAMGGTVVCAKIEGIRWLVHPNAKAIFTFHLILAFYIPLSYTVAFILDLIRLSADYSNPCDYTITTAMSVGVRIIPVVGLVSQSFTMCALSIERTISTVFANSYERIKEPTLGLALSGAAILLSCFQNYVLIIKHINWDSVQFITTIRTKDNSDYYQTQLYIFMSVEFATIIVLAINLYRNHQMCKIKLSSSRGLGNKYQLKENRLIIITLLPCFIVHFILNLISTFGITVWQKFYGSYDPIDSAVCIETLSHGQMYSLIMPMIILYRLRRKRNSRVVDEYASMDAHFNQLKAYW